MGETAGTDKDYEARLAAPSWTRPTFRRQSKERLAGLKKEELLREIVDNVGKRGRAGQDLQNVISVAMLSEGWDAKNVTHIMGLRAFTSQLLVRAGDRPRAAAGVLRSGRERAVPAGIRECLRRAAVDLSGRR